MRQWTRLLLPTVLTVVGGIAAADDTSSYYSISDASRAESPVWAPVSDASTEAADAGLAIGDADLSSTSCDSCVSCCCVVGGACGCCGESPLSITITSAGGYGTNNALPFQLTPFNPSVADDYFMQNGVNFQYSMPMGDDASFTAGYGFNDVRYDQLEVLDLSSHSVSGRFDRRLSDRAVGSIQYRYGYYFLSDSSFLNQNAADVSVYVRMNDVWDWKIAGGYSHVHFFQPAFSLVSSDNYTARYELIRYLFGGRDDYLTAGYAYGYSDAFFDGFTYRVHNVFAGIRHVFGYDGRNDINVTGSYGIYNFKQPDPFQLGPNREDDIWILTARLTRRVTDSLSVFGSYTWYETDSNVLRQNYQQNLTSVGVTLTR